MASERLHIVGIQSALEKLMARVNAREGYPKRGRNALTGSEVVPTRENPTFGMTMTHATIQRHPEGEWSALLLDAKLRSHIQTIRAEIAANVKTKKATVHDQEIAAIDFHEKVLDATWTRKQTNG